MPLRTPFQRDRDRIVHSKAFRRLKHKTQVFIDPKGDHYRTRLTHTLETAGISRAVARALRLNEDLAEAIALGHDLGHPPFGHTGEEALDEVARRALRPPLPPQRALASRRRGPRAGRARPQPHRRGARRDPPPHRAGGARNARGEDRPPRRPGRLHQPRHRRRDPRRRPRADELPRRRSSSSASAARGASTRSSTTSSRPPPEAGDIVQSEEVGRRDAQPARLHVRARLPRPGGRGTARGGETIRRIFDHLAEQPEDLRPTAPGDLPSGSPTTSPA